MSNSFGHRHILWELLSHILLRQLIFENVLLNVLKQSTQDVFHVTGRDVAIKLDHRMLGQLSLDEQIEQHVSRANSVYHQIEATIEHILHFIESTFLIDAFCIEIASNPVVFVSFVLDMRLILVFFVPRFHHVVLIITLHLFIFRILAITLLGLITLSSEFFGLGFGLLSRAIF